MQTFLPYPDFEKSLQVLDKKRLGKQRVEAMQIHNALVGKSKGWLNHPATKMWRGYEKALAHYHNLSIIEWQRRGCKNNMQLIPINVAIIMPPWFGSTDFHISHQSNLLRKDFEYYQKYFPNIPSDLPYIWPCQ